MSTNAEAEGNDSRSTTSTQLGLLDLSVDLSSPQIFSGSQFALFLRIKNPFAAPVWIHRVTTNLPTAVYQKDEQPYRTPDEKETARPSQDGSASAFLTESWKRLASLQERLRELEDLPPTEGSVQEASILHKEIDELQGQILQHRELLILQEGYDLLSVGRRATAHIEQAHFRRPAFLVGEEAMVHIESMTGGAEDLVRLQGALPFGVALQPGNESVWTITLGTRRNLFFLPAAYRLNLAVLYAFTPPVEGKPESKQELFSNTISTTVTIRTSLWSVMAGSLAGGLLGGSAHLLQQIGSSTSAQLTVGTGTGSLIVAAILSVAATIFAARKSETQSFVSVEDFWGGALIGFLIGFSGATAFQDITGFTSGSTQP